MGFGIKANRPLRIFIFFLVLSLPLIAQGFQETFTAGADDKGMPNGWKLKKWSGEGHQVALIEEDGRKALRLSSEKNSFGVYKEFDFRVETTPVLTWEWKVTRLPEKGDVRERDKDDQAAQIYVMFPRFPKMLNTRLVGYLWESNAPKDEKFTSKKSSNTRYIILQSGNENLGKWMKEKRNVYEDYRTLFGEEPPEGGGITMMIDSDDTGSSAESYFSDIRLEAVE